MELNQLWEQYGKTKDHKIREELIVHFLYLVKYVAGRLFASYSSHVEFDDLASYGVFGLIDAIDKYDVSRNVKFETYAQLRIRGAIIDHLREIDWLPRSVRQKAKELERAYSELENELGRSATDQEIADKLGVSIDVFHKKISTVSTYSLVSLDDLLEQKERRIVELYYYEELTYKEIGKILSISESRVSQLHTKAILKLRNKIGDSF